MKIIGVTGEIASGKSLVSFYLKQFNYRVFDADAVVRDLYKRDQQLISKIEQCFRGVVDLRGIDKGKLAKRLIGSPKNWAILEAIVHPVVIERLRMFIALCRRLHCKNIAIEMALLFETGADKFCNYIVLVKTKPKIQHERLIRRYGYDKDLIMDILAKYNDMPRDIHVIESGIEKNRIFNQVCHIA